jgi:protein SCO1
MSKPQLIAAIVVIMLTSMIGAGALAWFNTQRRATNTTIDVGTVAQQTRTFQCDLVDANGQPVRTETLHGHHALIYFGYTFCPDVCPTELAFLNKVITALGKDGEAITVAFITIDPERDTADRLKEYVPFFNPRFQAWLGTPEQTRVAADSIGAVYSKSTPVDAPEGFYLMNHSMAAFHIGPDGHLLTTYQSADGVTAVVERIRTLLKEYP